MNINKYLFLSLISFGFATSYAQNAPEVQIIPLEKKDLFKKDAITFYIGSGSTTLLDSIGKTIKDNLKFNFPNVDMQVSAPTIIGYQHHIRDNVSVGMVYSSSNVRTTDLDMPDFQNPALGSTYYYNIALSSLMASVDWYWMKFKRPKSTFALHSGLSLGLFNYQLTTEITKGSGSGVDQINASASTKAMQLTVIGVKHSMDALKGFGWFANFGIGYNSIGLTTGINWTL